MNILKKIGIALLVILALLAIVSLFLPGKLHIERSIVINTPAKTIFGTVNNLRTWANWSYWDRIDPNMNSTFEGPEAGVGAIHRWDSENDSVGHGSITITESVEPEKIGTSLEFDKKWTTPGGWTFNTTPEGVQTTIFMDMELPIYTRIPGLFMDKMLGKDFEKTLNGLKQYTENLPAESEASWVVETVTTTPSPVMNMTITTSQSGMQAHLGTAFEKIAEAMEKQGIKQSGPAYTLFQKWTKDTVIMEPGIMVNKAGKNDGAIMASEMKSVKAFKIDYYGEYSRMESAYNFITNWAEQNKTTIIGAPWEEYIADPKSEPDTAKWLTRIYFPIL